ncbi:alpha/beta fold hydrolase [Flavobacteriaceae bacterium TP-CH-4]|uniref:Alpha/beta fold hydrolase n=1 Tax=Pelagihabitans pacificus TaxID=2696054 RepID=A0A967AR35_9FLAO|nr:alpha/beta fold hydrolase [Pelagihabitans pacificus]NHF58829.1 alpha/beta fold hydrolase [Pelagihabitans pacificus]
MPLVSSSYRPPLLFKNGHFSTIYSGLVRSVEGVTQERERLDLPDGDFMDLDWSFSTIPTQKVIILLHGLEGNAQRAYIKGSAKIFKGHGYDACAVNLRSCSGEINRLYRSYHSGATEDLEAVINHILETRNYKDIYLKGFSLGGNMTLKYLGEGRDIPAEIKAAVAISVPCDLHSSLKQLLMPKNILYAIRFKKHLVGKLKAKQQLFPEKITDADIKAVETLKDFDDIYTSRAHGFKDALDYYTQCSSRQFLPNIPIPSLIINARNDSFLGPECYPHQEAEQNPQLFLEVTDYGGHVGFFDQGNAYYNEKRAIKFLNEVA